MADKKKNNDNNLISVIVPVYNIEPYLERCVDSIQRQTYTKVEILLVDNGSTDGSSKLVDMLAASDHRVVAIHEDNQGVTHARLTGVQRASGEWVGFVDGDDLIEPDMYERLLSNAFRYDAQISHCGFQMVFDDHVNYFYNTGRLAKQDNITGLSDLLDGSFVEPGLCNKLFHKTLFHSLLHDDVMDLSIKNNEDLLMNFILFKAADQSVYEDFCPYHYLIRKESASRGEVNQNRIFDPIKVKQVIIDIAPEELKDNAKAAYVSTCVNCYNGLLFDKTTNHEKSKIQSYLKEHKTWIALTKRRTRFMANGLLRFLWLYKPLYLFYCKWLQTRKYD